MKIIYIVALISLDVTRVVSILCYKMAARSEGVVCICSDILSRHIVVACC